MNLVPLLLGLILSPIGAVFGFYALTLPMQTYTGWECCHDDGTWIKTTGQARSSTYFFITAFSLAFLFAGIGGLWYGADLKSYFKIRNSQK